MRSLGIKGKFPLRNPLGSWPRHRWSDSYALRYSRTSGYLNCLAYTSSFKTFTAWYGWVFRSYREEQVTSLERGEPLSEVGRRFEAMVKVVKSSIDALVKAQTGWHSLE